MTDKQVTLDWRAPQHWGKSKQPCVYCRLKTNLRDEQGRPAHKTCAEKAINGA